MKHERPADIERTSMAIITQELADLGIELLSGGSSTPRRILTTPKTWCSPPTPSV